jgi:hypothetical protein
MCLTERAEYVTDPMKEQCQILCSEGLCSEGQNCLEGHAF